MAFLGDALAHAILPGVAIAYLLGANLLLGALVAAIVVAVGIGVFSRRGGLKEDTAIGILFAAALAFGVLLMSTVRSYATDLTHILFGNVLGVSASDLWLTGILAVIVLTVLIVVLQGVPAGVVRPRPRAHARQTARDAALHDADPAGAHHRRQPADRGRRTGRRHAGHAGGDRLSAHAPAGGDDGRLRRRSAPPRASPACTPATTSTWRRGRRSCSSPPPPSCSPTSSRRGAGSSPAAPRGAPA